MPLIDLDFLPEIKTLPDDVSAFLDEAQARLDVFVARRLDNPVLGFHPSDFPQVYHILRWIRHAQLAAGDRFCEWGSGLGVVASLAAMLGFESYGIEIDKSLVETAATLAEDFAVPVEFVHGSFIPDGFDVASEVPGSPNWLVTWGDSGYDKLDLEPEDFDVIYAYPWPGEAYQIEDLFEHVAATGTILITFHGCDEFRVRRKTSARRSR